VDKPGLIDVDSDKVIVAIARAWSKCGVNLSQFRGLGSEAEHGVSVRFALEF
jgi:hypothetical protein